MLDRGNRKVETHYETPFIQTPGACLRGDYQDESCNRPFGDFPVGRGFYEVSQGMQINLTNHGVIENIEVGMAIGKLIAKVP